MPDGCGSHVGKGRDRIECAVPPVTGDRDVAELEAPRLMHEQQVDDGAVDPRPKRLAARPQELGLDVGLRVHRSIGAGAIGHRRDRCVDIGRHRHEVRTRRRFGFAAIPRNERGEGLSRVGGERRDAAGDPDAADELGQLGGAGERVRRTGRHSDRRELVDAERAAASATSSVQPTSVRWGAGSEIPKPGRSRHTTRRPELVGRVLAAGRHESRARTAVEPEHDRSGGIAPLGESHGASVADLHRSLAPRTGSAVHRGDTNEPREAEPGWWYHLPARG